MDGHIIQRPDKMKIRDLDILIYWTKETQREIDRMKKRGAMNEEVAPLEIAVEDATKYVKNRYAELGINYIPCCDCGRTGGILTQLPNGEYKHLSTGFCKPQAKPPTEHRKANRGRGRPPEEGVLP